MRERVRNRLGGLATRYPRLAAAARTAPTVAGLATLLLAIVVFVGFALGSPGPTDSAPSVDFDAEPTAVVADASARVSHRNYTVESWVRAVDFRRGSVSGGLFYALRVEPDRGHVRGRLQPAGASGDYGFLDDRLPGEVFAGDGVAWARTSDSGYWQRSPPAVNLSSDAREVENWTRERLAPANLSVVGESDTAYVAETTDAPAVGFESVGTVRFVVAKGDDPHLQQVRYVQSAPTRRATRLVRVVERGESAAVRPAALPRTTATELGVRVSRGLSRALASDTGR